jgi:predicted small secreted protein
VVQGVSTKFKFFKEYEMKKKVALVGLITVVLAALVLTSCADVASGVETATIAGAVTFSNLSSNVVTVSVNGDKYELGVLGSKLVTGLGNTAKWSASSKGDRKVTYDDRAGFVRFSNGD